LEDHGDYKRYSYIGDNYTPNPDFAQPVKPAVTKLLFYCQISGHGVPAVENKNINRGSGVLPETASRCSCKWPKIFRAAPKRPKLCGTPPEGSPGNYTGQQTVHSNDDFLVDEIYFDAVDYNADDGQ